MRSVMRLKNGINLTYLVTPEMMQQKNQPGFSTPREKRISNFRASAVVCFVYLIPLNGLKKCRAAGMMTSTPLNFDHAEN